MNKKMKIFVLAIVANLIEDILLLLFFNVPITKQVLFGAGIFALTLFLLNKLIMEGNPSG